jgi:hypothetical protein
MKRYVLVALAVGVGMILGWASVTDSCAKNLTFQPRKDKPAAAKND